MKKTTRIIIFMTVSGLLYPQVPLAQSDLSCSFARFLPEPYREIVQEAFDVIFFEACERHDRCYGTCLVSTPIGYALQKNGCDAELLTQVYGACTAETILAAVAAGHEDPQEYTSVCYVLVAGMEIGLQSSLGENAYGSDQCRRCDCGLRELGFLPFNDSCLYFNEPCNAPSPGEGECPGVTQSDIDECEAIWGPGAWDPVFCMCRNPDTPLIVDLLGNGFDLTTASDGVLFDFRGGGIPVQTAWTSAGSDDAFLVLDRNRNGRVDDGTELFGNFSPQPPSAVPNGFAALEVYDLRENGGDGDGRITADDPIFDDLHLWIDRNHDGRSQPRELLNLRAARIKSLGLSYHESRRSDEHGNQFRFFSRVRLRNGAQRFMVDVFFAGSDVGTRSCRPQ